MNIEKQLAADLKIREDQVHAAVELIDEGNTIPFIARYRKEVTGALDDVVLRNLNERLVYLRNLEEKKEQVLRSIEEQGQLTEELKKKIEAAETMVAVDDLYRPYRPKKRTRATIAKEKGLEPLANLLFEQSSKEIPSVLAKDYINEELGVASAEDALAGAQDIIAEKISDLADYRKSIRQFTLKQGMLVSKAKDEKAESVYEMYYDFRTPVMGIAGHRVLAINRGEKEKLLTVKIEAPRPQIINALNRSFIKTTQPELEALLKNTIADSYDRLIAPSIERDIRNELTENAQEGAITVFGKNLKQLLMQPPIKGHTVLGWDPGNAHGCKLAVVDPTGKVLDTAIIYPTLPKRKVAESKRIVHQMIKKHHISLISVGNGTASRESEQVINSLIHEIPEKVSYIITNEAGASVYSASKLAQEEFPDLTVEERGAASIARRVQDPLAELVKIDSKAIGVGQYQHDMNQKRLEEALNGVVEDCVNAVGVDLNTASAPLLSYISGISKAVAKNIVTYREENGRFLSRKELLKVPKLGPKAYLQCAGFLRISDGKNPLDNTAVHPESYDAAESLLKTLGMSADSLRSGGLSNLKKQVKDLPSMAAQLGVGELTLGDILDELEKPGRDPRSDMPTPILRTDVLEMSDLKEGMVLKGTVRNVIDFGAFVDIGVHQDGLVHISQMSDKYIKHPLEVVSVGDIVDVKVMSVDLKKKRIQLTMKLG